jgi:uncharacterized protein (DUF1697 family)
MAAFVCLLRGINVGGRKKIRMADLVALCEALNLESARTYLQSGNLVCNSHEEPSVLSTKISNAIEKEFGYSVEVMVFTLEKWQHLVESNPFLDDTEKDIRHLQVTLLADEPNEHLLGNMDRVETRRDKYFIRGDAIYLYCPNGYGRTKLSNSFWERKLKVAATTRNWNTITKLLELAEEIQGE